MIALAGYENLIPIHHSEKSRVYRAQQVSDSQSVIIKFLAQDYPTSEQIRRYKQEYHLTCQLDSPGIVKAYSLEPWQKSYAIVLEDFGGISLRELLQEREKFSLSEFLDLAIAISESLAEIHAQNIIHKDINPANIVFNPHTQELKIIDFGIATQLSRENPSLKNPNVLEGTLTYISPEQTGRMNRDLDYRTDFYSLGVTFYEMLTGKLPFDSSDPLELVHCHIAKMPILGNGERATGNGQPSTNQDDIPQGLANIILKLMAKNAEDRYQSAYGLKADLENCHRQLKETGTIASYALGQQDLSDRFSIPQKLYGRSEEISTLLAAFARVAETGNVELMMVAGYSGIGKSSLVQELYKPIAARRGYFIAGKFDQLQRNIPYSALVVAFRGLVGHLLAETDANLQLWREKLLAALGANGQVIIDVIPEVELIIGQQPQVQGLEANESQNRFNLAFGNFINVFCNKEHPLTLFIDDLQWADLATLKLLKQMLVEGTTQYLFLLGAYRNNEVDASHPLAITLEQIRENHKVIQQITLQPLALAWINALIDDTLQPSPKTPELAGLVWQKTGGNPFFVNEFLQALYSENLLHFDRRSRTWQWDLVEIEAVGFTDNVVELMVNKLQKLPPSTQEILSIAACCGAEFDLESLTWVAEKSAQETFECLKVALDRGLILSRSELDENLVIQSYKFAHDRIQQAAYVMIPEGERAIAHYQIGKRLLQKIPPQAREQSIFKLVSQLNYGTDLITEQKERDRLAKLNSIACSKAKAATAYQAAQEYAKIGLSLLGQNCWQRQYKITLNFYELAAELSVLCGDFAEFERLFETTIKQSRSPVETVNIYWVKIKFYISQDRYIEAIEAGTKFLASMGIILPTAPTQEDIQNSSTEIETLIKNRKIEEFADLPKMQSPEKIAVVRIANSLIGATVATASPLLLLLVDLSVKLSIQYGNTESSGFTYGLYGHICCNIKQNIDIGVKFGELGLQVVSRFDARVIKPEILNVVGAFIWHHKYHLQEVLPLGIDGYTTGLETGNYEFAGYCAGMFCFSAFWSGQPLVKLEQDARVYSGKLMQLNLLRSGNQCRIYWQTILNLLGNVNHLTILSGEALSEQDFLSSNNDLSTLGIFYSYKLMLGYLFGDIEAALTYAIESRKYCMAMAGTFMEAGFYFYDALTSLRAVTLGLEESSEALRRVEDYQTKLQHWAEYAPMNYQHKVDLVAAEKCRVLGQKAEAIELYNQAISGANQYNYIQEEALANELAAKFYLDWNQEKVARVYMMDAHYCYSRWEAIAKVKQLEENYPQLCQSSIVRTSTTNSDRVSNSATVNQTTSYFTTSNSSSQLDISTLMKASQAIAGEIVLSRLLTQLIQIMVENTGARSGYLILETEGEFLIEAAASADGEIAVLQSMSLESVKPDGSSPLLCPAIVNYVARTNESVVLHDAEYEGNFTTQSYIQNFSVKSVLCVPLLNQGQLRGVVYLENNLTTGAFTQERVEIVKLLSGQAAIAITNAKLYTEVKQSEQRLIQFLEAIPVGVSIHKVTGQLHYANQTAQQLLGINIAPEAKTEEIAEAYQVYRAGTEDLYPNEELPVVRSLAGETVKADDLELQQPDKLLPIEVSSTPIFDKTGKVVYGIAAFQDITERKEAEKLLIDYNKSLEKQLALSLENTQLYAASKRFVPEQFLSFLNKKSIVDVELGDRVQREMTVLFSDIRDFTTISEQMSPEENFAFINEYLGCMEPQIQKYGGFIDKYIGDAIMALFPSSPDDAVSGAIAMLEELKQYNSHRQEQNLFPVRIGIGLHTGMLMLGTVGGMGRMDGTVIGDAVNLSSRVEGLTKTYGAALLITYQTWQSLNNPNDYEVRFIDKVKAKGKTEAVGLLEVFSAEPPELKSAKIATRTKFEKAVIFYHTGSFQEAASLFQECLEYHPGDRAAQIYLDRCRKS